MSRIRLRPGVFWALAMLAVWCVVARRFELTTWWREVALDDGRVVRLPVGWATVDHPFHVTRAETLLRALRDGELLRWVGHHQGGYPVEFYPTGVAWLEVILWALLGGQAPMEAVHRIFIGLVTLAPGVAFWWWSRGDGLTRGVAVVAGLMQVLIAGFWWSGGWTELALWGLVTNVAAQTATLFVLAGTVAWFGGGDRRALVGAVIATGIAVGSNPRSALGIGVVLVAALGVAAWAGGRPEARTLAMRVGVLGVLSAMACAPELVSLFRYGDLYYFVHYSGYDGMRSWIDGAASAVTWPVVSLAVIGCLLGLARPGRAVTRTAAVAAVLYCGVTACFAMSGTETVQQLEPTRLMPLQRMLMCYLAALAVHDLVVGLARQLRRGAGETRAAAALAVVGMAIALVYGAGWPAWSTPEERGARVVPETSRAPIGELEQAIRLADQQVEPGTAILVLGTVLSWHDGLWAPMWSSRPFFYDDWLWYWQQEHEGPYDPAVEHAYPDDRRALDPAYLAAHGIGAVVVTGDARSAATTAPELVSLATGSWWDVYRVASAVTIVTVDGVAPVTIDIGNQQIFASGGGDGGVALVRRNWFPRWRAEVNGVAVPVDRAAGGYMAVGVPAGPYTLRLEYGLDAIDWLARGAFATAALACAGLLLEGARGKRQRGKE